MTSESTALPSKDVDPDKVGAQILDCGVSVKTSGAVEVAWDVQGTVRTDTAGEGPKAVYRAQDKNDSLTVYSQGGGFTPSVTLSVDGTTFSTAEDEARGIDAATKGLTASIDVTATSAAGDEVDVVASFACGKQFKQG